MLNNKILENKMFENKLIDLFSHIDISEVETDYPDDDIEQLKFEESGFEKFWNNKLMRRATEVGVIAASITTGIIVAVKVINKKRNAA